MAVKKLKGVFEGKKDDRHMATYVKKDIFVQIKKVIYLPPLQVFWSGRSSTLSGQPQVLPVGVGRQKVLHNPLFSAQSE